MGKLVVVVGSSGVGKTALVKAICKHGSFIAGLEDHLSRPFQQFSKSDTRFTLANQVDYLLLRAEQENDLRQSDQPGIMDGGLEMDLFGYTRLFHFHGWLTDDEFDLCNRLYKMIRIHQPPPDFVIHLSAEPKVIFQRLNRRNRINIAGADDAPLLNSYIVEWLSGYSPDKVLHLDVSENDIGYRKLLPSLLNTIRSININ